MGGCGSGAERAAPPPPPRLPAGLAAQLASQSDQIAALLAAEDSCGALEAARTFRKDAIAAINAGRVAARFQEPLIGAANDLPLRIHCSPRAAPANADENREHDRKPNKHGNDEHGHGHGHEKGDG